MDAESSFATNIADVADKIIQKLEKSKKGKKSKPIRPNHKNILQNRDGRQALQIKDLALPGYSFVKPLGHGSQGNVFLARRESDGKAVAVKRLNIKSVKTWKSYELFHREAEVLKDLHIDGVATFCDAFDRLDDDPPCAYIIQEYIPGENLASLIKAGHRFSIDRVYDIMIQMLKIIKKLHEHTPPIIHRDIKPSNIILQPLKGDNFKVHLIDFGAVSNPQLQGGGSTVAGTYGFMPPEQLMGKPVPQSDIYALAAVAVNLITGKSPADMQIKDFYLIFEPEMQFMPVAVVDILRRMLDPKVENRLSEYYTLIHTFDQFRQGNYDVFNPPSHSRSSYGNDLKNVMSYAQPGNVELWQQLPDVRNYQFLNLFKDGFKFKKDKYLLSFGTESSIYVSEKNKIDEDYKINNLGGCVWFILLFIIFNVYFYIFLYHVDSSLKPYLFPSTFIVPPLLSSLVLFLFKRTLMMDHLFNDKLNHLENEMQDEFFKILKTGRKTIATIVSIDYLNAKDEYCEQNIRTNQFAVHQRPCFKVRYSFNPPDDNDPNDLVHEIIVHEDPDTFLQVGEPLPILYNIHIEADFENVYSIPFPLVISDVEQISDVLGCSKKEGI